MQLNKDLVENMFSDRTLRQKVTTQSHYWFFATYFPQYISSPTANMHRELFRITEEPDLPLAVIMAFRGSAKSTIMTMSYPIWAIMGKQQKKFVLIASQTQYQARVHLTTIKRELESNELLKNDLGPFVEQHEEWGATSLFIPKYGARITAISTEQSVRGIRHGPYRPDLIIADDVEDSNSVKTREGRNKTYDWYTGEIIPAGDTYTKRIVIGNLLHEDSLLMRLKERIEEDEIDGIFREWPIWKDGKSNWPGKYPDLASLENLKRKVANKIAWEREYLLNIISDNDQVIDRSWIKFYDELPDMEDPDNQYVGAFISVDLAISTRDTADYTSAVVIHAFGYDKLTRKYYMDKNFVNKRMTHLQTLETIEYMYSKLMQIDKIRRNDNCKILVEEVQYQAAVVEQLADRRLNTEGVRVHMDKRARLSLVSSIFESGRVFFPKSEDAKAIIQQIVGFGVEKHDDLADAVSMGLNYIQLNVEHHEYRISWI